MLDYLNRAFTEQPGPDELHNHSRVKLQWNLPFVSDFQGLRGTDCLSANVLHIHSIMSIKLIVIIQLQRIPSNSTNILTAISYSYICGARTQNSRTLPLSLINLLTTAVVVVFWLVPYFVPAILHTKPSNKICILALSIPNPFVHGGHIFGSIMVYFVAKTSNKQKHPNVRFVLGAFRKLPIHTNNQIDLTWKQEQEKVLNSSLEGRARDVFTGYTNCIR